MIDSMLVHRGDVTESLKAFLSRTYGTSVLEELSEEDMTRLYRNNLQAKEAILDNLNTLANYMALINFAEDVDGGAVNSNFQGYGVSLREDFDEYLYEEFLNGGDNSVN